MVEEEVLKVYDNILSGLEHISVLDIDIENVKKTLEYGRAKYLVDSDVLLAHMKFIGEVAFTVDTGNIYEVKRFITLPDFNVKTHMNNPEYFYRDSYSLEKSVIMGCHQEVNFIINDPRYRPVDAIRQILVLNVSKVSFSFDVDCYSLKFLSIPSSLFYDYYSRLILPYKAYRQIGDDDYTRIKSLAVRETLNLLDDVPTTEEGRFTLKKEDYETLKKYLKSKYNVDYEDKFISITGDEVSVWNNLGCSRFDNRVIGLLNGEKKPIPLSYQRKMK